MRLARTQKFRKSSRGTCGLFTFSSIFTHTNSERVSHARTSAAPSIGLSFRFLATEQPCPYRLRINVSGVPSSGFTKIMSLGSRLGVSIARKTTGPSIILGKA